MSALIRLERAWGPVVQGRALMLRDGVSPRYDLDRTTGTISRPGHSEEGQSLRDRVLFIPTTKGGVAGGWAFFDLLHKGYAPMALVFGKLNPVMVQGAVLARLPIGEGWSPDPMTTLRSGDLVRFDPVARTVELLGMANSR